METWNRYSIIIQNGTDSVALQVEEYEAFGEFARKFVRIYGPGFDRKKEVCRQIFGFGPTFDIALAKLFWTFESVRKGIDPSTVKPPHKTNMLGRYGLGRD